MIPVTTFRAHHMAGLITYDNYNSPNVKIPNMLTFFCPPDPHRATDVRIRQNKKSHSNANTALLTHVKTPKAEPTG